MGISDKKPVCFIAMAFDREDTDYLYENQILPVLKRNDINPIIINRQQSNDDLNFQIIEQLQKADLCITDLTYARQSVYFEAGYAQRVIPVIYTVRQDHLRSGQPDNLRVHFDLQMKPLITWKSQDDPVFSEKLEQRIRKTFLINWNRKQSTEVKYQKAIQEFNSLSLSERLATVRREAVQTLQNLGVKPSDWSDEAGFGDDYHTYVKSSVILNGEINYIQALQKRKKIPHFYSIQSFQSLSKRELTLLSRKYSADSILQSFQPESNKKTQLDFVKGDILVLSLKSTPSVENAHVFDQFIPLQQPFRYHGEFQISPYWYGHKTIKIIITFYFLGGIKSKLHLQEQLKMVELQIKQNLKAK
jgi:hypothetical protein